MPMTFDDEDCYRLFLIVDTQARNYEGENKMVNRLRETLLPFYRDWHAANPHKVNPSCYER